MSVDVVLSEFSGADLSSLGPPPIRNEFGYLRPEFQGKNQPIFVGLLFSAREQDLGGVVDRA